jgi:HJR/Mrr/RecB family endonuclease
MTNFYSSKNSKKQEYNNMVEFYDHDRPLTNSIRRREYDFMKPE